MLRILVGLAGGLLLSGCVSTKNVKADAAALAAASYPAVTVTRRALPDFAATTAGKAGFGLVGQMAIIAEGNRLVAEHGIADPAIAIRAELARRLGERLGVPVQMGQVEVDSGNPSMIAKGYAGAGLLLDVQTINWGFIYFPTDWNNYGTIYVAKLRLVDASTGKLVAEGFCRRTPKKSDDSPSHDALLADGAAQLKSRLQASGAECIEELAPILLDAA